MANYGSAQILALSQTGIQATESSYPQDSACIVQASWFDTTGAPYTPKLVNYRLDDVASGIQILAWTSIAPAAVNSVTVTSAQNSMVNATETSETHQALFQITDQAGNVYYAHCRFEIERTAGAP